MAKRELGSVGTPRATNPLIGPLIVTNLAVLVVLLFGPNSNHQNAWFAFAGVAVALAGVAALVRVIVLRGRGGASFGDRGQ